MMRVLLHWQDWQNVFKHFDRDRSGFIERDELQRALAQFGSVFFVFHRTTFKLGTTFIHRYHLPPYIVAEVQKKFGKLITPTRRFRIRRTY